MSSKTHERRPDLLFRLLEAPLKQQGPDKPEAGLWPSASADRFGLFNEVNEGGRIPLLADKHARRYLEQLTNEIQIGRADGQFEGALIIPSFGQPSRGRRQYLVATAGRMMAACVIDEKFPEKSVEAE